MFLFGFGMVGTIASIAMVLTILKPTFKTFGIGMAFGILSLDFRAPTLTTLQPLKLVLNRLV